MVALVQQMGLSQALLAVYTLLQLLPYIPPPALYRHSLPGGRTSPQLALLLASLLAPLQALVCLAAPQTVGRTNAFCSLPGRRLIELFCAIPVQPLDSRAR
jgi:hypothetical protein